MSDLDDDLAMLSHVDLLSEAQKMRSAIRNHRDSTMHKLCWHHPDLWNLLPDKAGLAVAVPEWPQFMRGCVRYRQSLDEQLPDAPRIAEEFGEN